MKAYKRASQENDDRSAHSAHAALELIIGVIDEAAEHNKDQQFWQKLETLIAGFTAELLQQDTQTGVWEMGVQMLSSLTFEPPYPNGPQVWALLPAIHKSWQEWAKDYGCEIADVWDNFITNNPERCASSADIMQAINEVLKYSLRADADADEQEGGLKLMECCLANMRGKIDKFIGPWLSLLFEKIKTDSAEDNEESVIDIMAVAVLFFFYNPVMTLGMLEKNNLTHQLLGNVFEQSSLMHTVRNKKISIIGLSSILHLKTEVPNSVKKMYPQLIHCLLDLQMELWQQQDEIKAWKEAEDKAYDDDFDSGEEEPGQAFGGGKEGQIEDVPDNVDVYDIQAGGFLEFEDDEMEANFGAMKQIDDASPCHTLEKFDETNFWFEGAQAFAKSNSDVFNKIMNGLGKQDQEFHKKLAILAQEKRESKQKEEENSKKNNNNK